ncbi:unnamed protein product [Pseudo-nitzschia multistriata]|uniref:Uncharacterized protein n=1 Tax=Pseudo-nitzschia multistriata TaxID=183589 RepID=A0A448ZAP4_9STRA|nr:unnamed protein product [Pseudo-nitzschia multistriata]
MSKENEVPKLDNKDVRAIFESLYDNRPAPPGLKFQIVPVGPNGQGLSPPNHEYEDGIYVLLRPDKSKKNKKNKKGSSNDYERPKIPPHLAHLKMKTPLSNGTKWSLSGPQFPRPTAIQQRYCYPQGDSEYASKKGAALWTMYNCNGKEDKEYRLLHVYFSVKRANNTGRNALSVSVCSKASSMSSKASTKRVNRKRAILDARKGGKRQKRPYSKTGHDSKLSGVLPPSSPVRANGPIFRPPFVNVSPNTASASSRVIERNLSRDGSFGDNFGNHRIYTIPSYLLNGDDESYDTSPALNAVDDIFRGSELPDAARDYDNMMGVELADPSSMMRVACIDWPTLNDSASAKHARHHYQQSSETFPQVLVGKLKTLHEKIIHEWVGSRPRSEQGLLINLVANWARSISRSPLELNRIDRDVKEESDDISGAVGLIDSLVVDEDVAIAV